MVFMAFLYSFGLAVVSNLTLKASLLIIDEVVDFSNNPLKTFILMLALVVTTSITLFAFAGAITFFMYGLGMIV